MLSYCGKRFWCNSVNTEKAGEDWEIRTNSFLLEITGPHRRGTGRLCSLCRFHTHARQTHAQTHKHTRTRINTEHYVHKNSPTVCVCVCVCLCVLLLFACALNLSLSVSPCSLSPSIALSLLHLNFIFHFKLLYPQDKVSYWNLLSLFLKPFSTRPPPVSTPRAGGLDAGSGGAGLPGGTGR